MKAPLRSGAAMIGVNDRLTDEPAATWAHTVVGREGTEERAQATDSELHSAVGPHGGVKIERDVISGPSRAFARTFGREATRAEARLMVERSRGARGGHYP